MVDPSLSEEMASESSGEDDMGYHPNMSKGNGLFCFKDVTRPCGADCMAFLPQVPEGAQYQGAQWAHCQVLVNSDRSARHLVIITNLLSDVVKMQKSEAAKAIRTQKPPPV